ncbi:MAG: aminoacyl-histidine dipeptidase [Bacteroidales bacterium]|nr:aminoacyl-histidine dipeptidase [Bacteroidales bacterium]
MTIKDLNPTIVWKNFYGLTQIPRPSKHEEKVIEYLYQWGKDHGVETIKDETGNIIMRKPATPGFENRRGVILQGHMDMVPQKTASTKHDFLTDPIQTEIIGEWVGAKGTTLGADNGIGVAMALAVMEDDTLQHGPVEALITYDEETGMTGADALKPGLFKGDIFLNLDSESEGELCIGCAGGLDGTGDFKYRTYKTPEGYAAYKIIVKGLQGGHSGMDISLYRANANKIVARVLTPLIETLGVKVADIKGGSLRNAIPFEGEALVLVPEANVKAAKETAARIFAEVKAEHQYSDPSAEFHFEKAAKAPARYIQDSVIRRAVKAIVACPNGVIRMSDSMKGLTETSTNLAIVKCEKGHLKVHSLMRSAVDSSKANLAEQMRAVFELAGAEFTTAGGYNGWTPKPETPVYVTVREAWKAMTGKEMEVMATHGGLECALLGAKYPNWEMVSIGPDIVHPHSPDERVRIQSVANVWEFLKKLLLEVPEK